jgi:hypothetical protein
MMEEEKKQHNKAKRMKWDVKNKKQHNNDHHYPTKLDNTSPSPTDKSAKSSLVTPVKMNTCNHAATKDSVTDNTENNKMKNESTEDVIGCMSHWVISHHIYFWYTIASSIYFSLHHSFPN